MITAHERVAREDLLTFINACFACSGQREFYSDARGQAVSIEFLHAYVAGNYRALYARTLGAGINHFNQGEAILRLLATGKALAPAHRAEEGALIAAALRALPVHRAHHLLEALRTRRINNRRARAIARAYVNERRDPAFEAVKYRRCLHALAAHLHVAPRGERADFLFHGPRARRYETPIFESFRRAHYAAEALYDLPFSIAEGLARKHRVPRETFLARIAPRLSAGERLRLQQSSRRVLGEGVAMDLGAAPPTRLASYLLGLPMKERLARREELRLALDHAAHRAARRHGERYGKVAAVLDCSWSSSGSGEKRRRPLAVALATSALLRAASREYRAFWTGAVDDEILVEARGASDLATPLLDALDWGADTIVIVSDGYENDPPAGAAELLRVYRAKIAPEGGPFLAHLNPVFDSEALAPRALSPLLPAMGVRDAEDLFTMLGFARFAGGAATLAELESYLGRRAQRLISGESETS